MTLFYVITLSGVAKHTNLSANASSTGHFDYKGYTRHEIYDQLYKETTKELADTLGELRNNPVCIFFSLEPNFIPA